MRGVTFTPFHRGGSGPPLVALHGVLDSWHVWLPVLPALERRHDVLAPTLPGHAGGPPIEGPVATSTLLDVVERQMDEAGFATAHLVGNSLGGHLALRLAERGRARSVVALAPAGGWSAGTDPELFDRQQAFYEATKAAAPHLRDQRTLAVASAHGARRLIEHARTADWSLDAQRITCPVRVIWGTEDEILPWPDAAARFRRDWLPHADWIVLDGVGHHPQVEVPVETAQLILGITDVENPRAAPTPS
jgi:pimeloyl-ACP methyl ester carboxylesterase